MRSCIQCGEEIPYGEFCSNYCYNIFVNGEEQGKTYSDPPPEGDIPQGPGGARSILDKKNPPFRGDSFTFLYIQSVTFDLVIP